MSLTPRAGPSGVSVASHLARSPAAPRKKRNAKRLALNRLRLRDSEVPQVLFESPGLLGVLKPAGVAVQGDYRRVNSAKWRDFLQMLQSQYGRLYAVDRLDAYTSGAYLFARNRNQSQRINHLFEHNRIPKTFLGVVYGDLPNKKYWIEAPTVAMSDGSAGKRVEGWFRVDEHETTKSSQGRPDARVFINNISLVQSSPDGRFHLLRIEPKTSVKHGVRAQLALQLKAPIVGDYKYADLPTHSTFHWLNYEGSFAMALHCLDLSVSTYHNTHGRKRDKQVESVFAEPPELFIETLDTLGITALKDGLIRAGEFRRESPSKGEVKPPVRSTGTALSVKTNTSASIVALSGSSRQTGVTEADKAERNRLRRIFDPERRLREAFDASLVPSNPLTSVLLAHRPHKERISNEVAAVRSGRLRPGQLVGIIELRRRRRATKLAKARGENPNRLQRPSARSIRQKPRLGMSQEYTPQGVALSPRAVRRRQAQLARKKSRTGRPILLRLGRAPKRIRA